MSDYAFYRTYANKRSVMSRLSEFDTKKFAIRFLLFFFLWHTVIYTYTKFFGYSDNEHFRKYQLWLINEGQGLLIISLIIFVCLTVNVKTL